VFLEGVYRRIERLLEGPREARIRLARAKWTAGWILRKTGKHALYILVSLALAHVALAFFVSLPGTFELVRQDPRQNWTPFLWVMAFTGGLYFNFAWFREQMCVVVCPYGRLQSALLDRDTIIVGYDVKRGEPRGKKQRSGTLGLPVVQEKRGDCVDCARCVNVCPTGIDIRNGTQMECIGCTQCIDACDDVMHRLGLPPGLIRYDSQNGLETRPKRTIRPRLLLMGGLLALAAVLLVGALVERTHLEANLLRGHGAPYVLDSGEIRNQFELHLVNKNPGESTLTVEVDSPQAVDLKLPMKEVKLASLDHFRLPVFVSVHDADFTRPFPVTFVVRDSASHEEKRVTTNFLGPVR
jgi:cytochrome c oxidase accessory protein FixG